MHVDSTWLISTLIFTVLHYCSDLRTAFHISTVLRTFLQCSAHFYSTLHISAVLCGIIFVGLSEIQYVGFQASAAAE